jgi:hypothetical protein
VTVTIDNLLVQGIAIVGLVLFQSVANAQSNTATPEAADDCRRVPERALRLACYDRAFPPITEAIDDDDLLPPREERVAPAAAPEPSAPTARIVEVEMPSLDTTLFRAADGRVFVRERATTVVRWPDTPFDVEIETSIFGTSTYLRLPGGRRIRVAHLE